MLSTPYLFNELYDIFRKAPFYTVCLEIVLVIVVVWLVFHQTKSNGKKLTAEEKAAILEKWLPEPLVEETPENHPSLSRNIVTGKVGKRVIVDGYDCLNLATHNYLGLLEDEKIQADAIASLRKYGVGSCGPRGFYGTVDVHLILEERLANFMEMEEAVIYSYGFSTIASAIPAYCKRGDLVFVDEKVNFAIQKGLDASRSKIIFYKHNNMADLERCLMEQQKTDKKNPKKAARTRRFLIAEAIYMNTGEMCPLRELVKLRQTYKLRLFLDESISFGTLGKSGRGLTEHLNVDRSEIDCICGSLEWAVGSIGGFCVGSTFIVNHQTLSGLGYVFSASTPPLLTQAAISALDRFENNPEIFKELNVCCEKLHNSFNKLSHMILTGDSLSPVKHLYLRIRPDDHETEKILLRKIVDSCRKIQLALVNSEYLEHIEKNCPQPSIRITANRLLTDDDIEFAYNTLENVTKSIFD